MRLFLNASRGRWLCVGVGNNGHELGVSSSCRRRGLEVENRGGSCGLGGMDVLDDKLTNSPRVLAFCDYFDLESSLIITLNIPGLEFSQLS